MVLLDRKMHSEGEKMTIANQFDIGNRIQHLRKSHDMTAKELAEIIEISPSFISAVENNSTKLSLKTLRRICDALGVTLAEFFNENLSSVEQRLISTVKRLPEEKKYELLMFLEGLF